LIHPVQLTLLLLVVKLNLILIYLIYLELAQSVFCS